MIAKHLRQGLLVLGLLAAGGAQAVIVPTCALGLCTYYGLRATDGSVVPDLPSGDPLDARTAFLAAVNGPTTETFTGFNLFDPQQPAVTLDIFGSAATLSGDTNGVTHFLVSDNATSTPVGRYDTTGTTSPDERLLEAVNSFTVTFASAIRAFGFYGTDIGDFAGGGTALTVDLLDGNGGTIESYAVPGSGVNGSLLFWGFTSNQDVSRIVLTAGGGTSEDGLGFDDMVFARSLVTPNPDDPNPTPEPASLALGGLALVALGALRRRRR